VRSEQVSEQRAGGGAGGVPGSLSNEPPVPGSVAPLAKGKSAASAGASAASSSSTAASAPQSNTGAGGQSGQSGQSGTKAAVQPVGTPGGGHVLSSNITRNYEIDRTLNYSRQPPGRIRRLSVAVLIGYHPVKDAKGKVKDVPLSAQELARVTNLVKDAVGFNAARGDSVSVVNEPLDTPPSPSSGGEVTGPSLWQQPLFWSLAKIASGLVAVLLLALVVLRPMVRLLLTPVSHAPALPSEADGDAGAAPQAQKEAVVKALSHEQQLANARALVSQDPKRVAQMVRGWVGTDE